RWLNFYLQKHLASSFEARYRADTGDAATSYRALVSGHSEPILCALAIAVKAMGAAEMEDKTLASTRCTPCRSGSTPHWFVSCPFGVRRIGKELPIRCPAPGSPKRTSNQSGKARKYFRFLSSFLATARPT